MVWVRWSWCTYRNLLIHPTFPFHCSEAWPIRRMSVDYTVHRCTRLSCLFLCRIKKFDMIRTVSIWKLWICSLIRSLAVSRTVPSRILIQSEWLVEDVHLMLLGFQVFLRRFSFEMSIGEGSLIQTFSKNYILVTAKYSVRVNFQVLIDGCYIILLRFFKYQIERLTMLFHASCDLNWWPFILFIIHGLIYSEHGRYGDFFGGHIRFWCLLGGCVFWQCMRINHRWLLFHDHDFGSDVLPLALDQRDFFLIWCCVLLNYFVFENRYLFLTLNFIDWRLWATFIHVLLGI